MRWVFGIQFLLLLSFVSPIEAVPGSGKLVRETAEYMVKKWGRETVGEGIEASVAKLVRQHGEEIAPLLRKNGPQMIRVMEDLGAEALPLIRRFGNDGIEVLARSGETVLTQVRRFGDDAMEVAIRHRGIGENLIAELGEEGVRLGKQLSTEEVVQTLKLLPALKSQNGVQAFIGAVDQYGSAVFRYIGRHPEVAAGGAALALLLAKPEIVIDGLEAVGTGVGRGVRAAGEEIIGVGNPLTRMIWVALIFALITAIVAGPRFVRAWLAHRLQVKVESRRNDRE